VRPARGRVLWPAAAACLAVFAAGLGARLAAERGERLALAEQLRLATLRPATPAPPPAPAPGPASDDRPAADSLLASHRVIERGLDSPAVTAGVEPPGLAPRDAPVLRVRPPEGWPEL
jgi:hypothetical protein